MAADADEAQAVRNAIPAVKDAATSVLYSNDDAVTRWIANDHQTI